MIKLGLLFVLMTIAYIQCAPTPSFIDSYISNVSSFPTEVDKIVDVQYKEQDQLPTESVHSTINPNELSIYYKWLAFLKSSTSTTANDFTNQPKTA